MQIWIKSLIYTALQTFKCVFTYNEDHKLKQVNSMFWAGSNININGDKKGIYFII